MVENWINLTNKIKNIGIPSDSTAASLNVDNLFTNIPINQLLKIIEKQLRYYNIADVKLLRNL